MQPQFPLDMAAGMPVACPSRKVHLELSQSPERSWLHRQDTEAAFLGRWKELDQGQLGRPYESSITKLRALCYLMNLKQRPRETVKNSVMGGGITRLAGFENDGLFPTFSSV